jgi:hypothetical protein
MECHIEIFIDGRWATAAVFEPDPRKADQGAGGGGRLQGGQAAAGCKEVRRLPDLMEHHHVDDDIIQRLAGWIDDVAAGLEEARPQTWRSETA